MFLGNFILDNMFLYHKKQNTFVSLMRNNVVSDFLEMILFQTKYKPLTRGGGYFVCFFLKNTKLLFFSWHMYAEQFDTPHSIF